MTDKQTYGKAPPDCRWVDGVGWVHKARLNDDGSPVGCQNCGALLRYRYEEHGCTM